MSNNNNTNVSFNGRIVITILKTIIMAVVAIVIVTVVEIKPMKVDVARKKNARPYPTTEIPRRAV